MRGVKYQLLLILSAFWGLSGCVNNPVLTAEQLKGPVVKVQKNRLAQTQADACSQIKALQIPATEYKKAAQESGILEDDFFALQQTVKTEQITITIREVNKSCAPYLRAGYPSKGHSVITKTFTAESLPPQYKYLAGTVSTLKQKPKPGEIVKDPLSKQYLTKDGDILTCDYDLMDVAEASGQRIEGETEYDLSIRKNLNDHLPKRGQPPHVMPRFMHGAQAEYPNYLRVKAEKGDAEEPMLELNQPGIPITAITYRGELYRILQVEDALNFYHCYNINIPPEWNIQH